MWTFEPRFRLAPPYPPRRPLSGVGCKVRLSKKVTLYIGRDAFPLSTALRQMAPLIVP
jgi:hypothetical protein